MAATFLRPLRFAFRRIANRNCYEHPKAKLSLLFQSPYSKAGPKCRISSRHQHNAQKLVAQLDNKENTHVYTSKAKKDESTNGVIRNKSWATFKILNIGAKAINI